MCQRVNIICAACCSVVAVGAAAAAFAGVVLVDEGVARCHIELSDAASSSERFGARELATYLSKVTGCGEIAIGTLGVAEGRTVVSIRTSPSADLKEDGFSIDAMSNRVEVVGANPRGALYGCYEVLKRHAGMRWLLPGEDGEYCVHTGKTVVVPEGHVVCNPQFRIRRFVGGGTETYLWYARNNMFGSAPKRAFENPDGTPTANCALYEALCVKGEGTYGNSHIFSEMMCNWDTTDPIGRLHKLFAEHPEYFPLIDGKRCPTTHLPIGGIENANPCVSNPALIDIMAENLYARICGQHGSEEYITIGNNDTTVWCECEKCCALDAPALKGTKGARADRYWYAVMEIARRIWAKDAKIRLGGWAYQDFWYPPKNVKIDPRLRVLVSYNNQCWRHAVDNPKCKVNEEWRKIFTAWRKTGLPIIVNRDEIGCEGSVGSTYAPVESVLRDNFRAYPSYGCSGSSFCVESPFPSLLKHRVNSGPYYGCNLYWYAMWQTCYMSARQMWDPGRDFDAELEEANKLYYGVSWAGGMREFRDELKRVFFSKNECIGWGHKSTIGMAMEDAAVEKRLLKHLAKAAAVAESSGDLRSLAHVKRDQDIFALTWQKSAKLYRLGYRELRAYPRVDPIEIDGELNDPDWKRAFVLTDFEAGGHTPKGSKIHQTKVRVVHSPDTLYIAVECLEPDMGNRIAVADLPANPSLACRQMGDHVEVFYNYPDMAEKSYHLLINSKGAMVENKILSLETNDFTYRSNAKWAVKDFADHWTLELALPTSAIGMKCFPGAVWKLNVGRCRKVKGLGKYPETSSASHGNFRWTPGFVSLRFYDKPKGLKAMLSPRRKMGHK